MRSSWIARIGLVASALLLTAGALAALATKAHARPAAAGSAAPLVGIWEYYDRGPVLSVEWEPRGIRGPKSEEFLAKVIRDFQFASGSKCQLRAGDVFGMFFKGAKAAWPVEFVGTGTLPRADVLGGSDCSPIEVTMTLTGLGEGTRDGRRYLSHGFCYGTNPERLTCNAGFFRRLGAGEALPSKTWGQYVFPGVWKPSEGGSVAFVVDAHGSFTSPSGRWIRDLSGSQPLRCSTWSPKTGKWVPARGKSGFRWARTVPIADAATVSVSTLARAERTATRLQLQGRFVTWTRLDGTIRYVAYSAAGRLPRDPDRPGKVAVTRCDSGTVEFRAEHVPGSWQAIAGDRK